MKRHVGPSILPGGRIVAPYGQEHPTGVGAFGLAISPSGTRVITSSGGIRWNTVTIAEKNAGAVWQSREFDLDDPDQSAAADGGHPEWRSTFIGLAFTGEKAVFASEGISGRVSLFEWNTDRRRVISLNQKGFQDSDAGDMALDSTRGWLYVADRANSRIAVIQTANRQLVASVQVEGVPFAVALSPDRQELYATCHAKEAEKGSVAVVDVSNPLAPRVETSIPVPGPSGIAVSSSHVFVANRADDSILVIDPQTNRVEAEIPIRIPGLEQLRGVEPLGLAWHQRSGKLLVAEAGINAVGVIDIAGRQVAGHIPAGWCPTRVAVHQETVFVANARGHGSGPNAGPWMLRPEHLRMGTLSAFPLPAAPELAQQTALVMDLNGFRPRPADPRPLPEGVKHVVVIMKEGRSYDEVMGDLGTASNGPAMGDPALARFGASGFAYGRGARLSIKGANIAPNHRAIAQRWSFSDNFYADAGDILNAWMPVWGHFSRHGVPYFGSLEGSRTVENVPDQLRASRFIEEIGTKYVKTGADLPPFLLLHLPNGRMARARPADGYPYEESFVADNDYAMGRILEFLSGTKWWKEMAVLITEDDAGAGLDHIDEHRTLLYVAGPWAKPNYASHGNSSFPGLLKTIFRLLKLPPMNLLDAAATDLSDCFRMQLDTAPYKALPVDPRIFDPASAAPR